MPSTAGYDVFISYNRRQDGWLAPALQAGLERFAKPWYRISALRVFRDTASLAASPELWGTIEAALRDSRWLILLASPEAAQSSWVDREVAWWLAESLRTGCWSSRHPRACAGTRRRGTGPKTRRSRLRCAARPGQSRCGST